MAIFVFRIFHLVNKLVMFSSKGYLSQVLTRVSKLSLIDIYAPTQRKVLEIRAFVDSL